MKLPSEIEARNPGFVGMDGAWILHASSERRDSEFGDCGSRVAGVPLSAARLHGRGVCYRCFPHHDNGGAR